VTGGLQHQFRTGKWTLLLDGRVVEVFHEGTDVAQRYHVDHLAIGTSPDGLGLKVKWGIGVRGMIMNGGKATLPPEDVPAFNDFVARAITNRTPGVGA